MWSIVVTSEAVLLPRVRALMPRHYGLLLSEIATRLTSRAGVLQHAWCVTIMACHGRGKGSAVVSGRWGVSIQDANTADETVQPLPFLTGIRRGYGL